MPLSLTGRGGAKAGTAAYSDAGYCDIHSFIEDCDSVFQEELAEPGLNIYLQLNEDGTGFLDQGNGDPTELTWQDGADLG